MDGEWTGSTALLCGLFQSSIYTAVLSFYGGNSPVEIAEEFTVDMIEELTQK